MLDATTATPEARDAARNPFCAYRVEAVMTRE